MIQPPDFTQAKNVEELNRMADDFLKSSKAWSLWMRKSGVNLHVLRFFWIVGNYAIPAEVLGLKILGAHVPIHVLLVYAVWLTFGFFVRGRIQDIARECGGIWVNGDFTVPK